MKVLKWIFSCLILLTLVAGCNKEKAQEEEAKVSVKIEKVAKGFVAQSLAFHGDIEAEFEVKVFSKIPDRIEAFSVDEGDHIKKGALVADIMATTIEQGVLQAEAQKNNMEAEYARAKRLRKENAMSQQQFDMIETQYAQARAAYKTAKSQLNDSRVVAPISGIIGKRYYETGDMAAPALPLVSIVQMDRVKIEFDATEEDLSKLKIGQKAFVEVRTYPDRKFEGEVTRISPVLDPMTRMATIEIIVNNKDHSLKPGMYADVEVITGQIEDTIIVPRNAVLVSTTLDQDNGEDRVVKQYFIYVATDSSRSEQRELDVLYVNHRYVAVNDGIEVGEQMVVEGHKNLRDDMALFIVNEETE